MLVAMALMGLLGFCGLVLDGGNVYLEKTKLQNTVDAAALAGAQSLTNTSDATSYARASIVANGQDPANAKPWPPTFSAGNTQITVTMAKVVPTYFMKLFGTSFATANVTATATAEITADSVFDYAIFSGSKTVSLTLDAKSNITGDVHTNQNLIVKNNTVVTGTAEYVGTITNSGTITKTSQSGVINMPDLNYNNKIIKLAQEGTTYTAGDYTTSASTLGSMYIPNGGFISNGADFSETGLIVAYGDIVINGSGLNSGTFYSINGSIKINGNGATFNGVVYAPNGSVRFDGSGQTVNGSVVGDTVVDNGAKFTVSYVDYTPVLPYSSVRLIK